MALILILCVVFGALAAFTIAGHVMYNFENPYHRVNLLCAVMVLDLAALVLASIYFPSAVSAVFIFTFTKVGLWSIMNIRNIVHLQYPKEQSE